jgi:transcriptional regulator with XRE-family HTH domain
MNGIKAIRTQLGLSQTEFGEALGMTQGNVSLYEVADQTVTPKVANRIIQLAAAKGFHCTFNDVYSESPKLKKSRASAAGGPVPDVAAPAAQAA